MLIISGVLLKPHLATCIIAFLKFGLFLTFYLQTPILSFKADCILHLYGFIYSPDEFAPKKQRVEETGEVFII